MLDSTFSLLYPNGEDTPEQRVNISDEVIAELGLDFLIDLKNSNLADYFTTDKATIEYRIDTMNDMLENPTIVDTLKSTLKLLNDIIELRQIKSETEVGKNYLYSITEIELYIDIVSRLAKGFQSVKGNVKSSAFKRMTETVTELSESEYYRNLNKQLGELTAKVHDVKSITVGVNLDSEFRPVDAGVVSLNAEQFKSGKVIDKILRMDFKDDDYTCIAPLVPYTRSNTDNAKIAFTNAFNNAMNDIFKADVRQWRQLVQSYVLSNTDFLLRIMPEIEFLTKAQHLLLALKSRGMSLVKPEIADIDAREFNIKGIYNPCVALKVDSKMVKNDINFDENAKIYVLTGPNRGGKSVITCAVGQTQALAQLGLPVPADYAVISPVTAIYTHFPTGSEGDGAIEKGRLGEECDRLNKIFDTLDKYSLILLDESFSSTGSYEASYIASEVLTGFSMIGCRCLFSTHLHELSSQLDEINAKCSAEGGVPIDTLVAGIHGGGERSFEIIRAKPDGKSYARDIAEKFGLSYDRIMSRATRGLPLDR
ncbi:MAG: hypothetical protein HFE63_05810 [Clostridiales bacterium]|nr:hypothetical protein [Clostridiales bacterium]